MKKTFPIVWALHGRTHTGKLEAVKDRVELTSRGYTLSFPSATVINFEVERGAETRIRGLPVVTIRLIGGEVVRVASLGGAGSLHEIAALLAAAEDDAAVRPQLVEAAGT